MEQRVVIKFYFKSGSTATEAYRDLKNVYDDVRAMPKSSCVSRVLKKTAYHRRMILVLAGQFPLGPMEMWRKLAPP
jgi:hypothetical protein